jgi:hypothetical protein
MLTREDEKLRIQMKKRKNLIMFIHKCCKNLSKKKKLHEVFGLDVLAMFFGIFRRRFDDNFFSPPRKMDDGEQTFSPNFSISF